MNVLSGLTQTTAAGSQVNETPLPGPEDLFLKWKNEQTVPLSDVVMSLEPVVRKANDTFGGSNRLLLPRARLLAAEAVQKYDPKKASSLASFTFSHLQRLNRVREDRQEAVHVPERSRVDAILIRNTVEGFRSLYGYEPDILTIREQTGLSPSRIKAAEKAYKELSESATTGEKGDTLFVSDKADPEDAWRDCVYYDLDPAGRKIFEWTTGYGGSRIIKKNEIARRLKITPAAVSSRISSIVKRLEQRPSEQFG